MSYLKSTLAKDEDVIYKASVHWIIYAGSVLFLILTVFLIMIGAATGGSSTPRGSLANLGAGLCFMLAIANLVLALVRAKTTELVVTSKRVLCKVGFIRRNTWELNRRQVEGLRVSQSIVGRLFGYGDIVVTGTGGDITPVRFISNPIGFRNAVR